MEIKASLNNLRMSPRKVRLVANLVKNMSVNKAENQLKFLPKRATGPVLKLLKSAVANAENNFNLKRGNLYISNIIVDGGPVLKRMRPRAFGRAAQILKRTSHISLLLGVKEGQINEEISEHIPSNQYAEIEKDGDGNQLKKNQERKSFGRPRIRENLEKPKIMKQSKDFVRRVFNRKAI